MCLCESSQWLLVTSVSATLVFWLSTRTFCWSKTGGSYASHVDMSILEVSASTVRLSRSSQPGGKGVVPHSVRHTVPQAAWYHSTAVELVLYLVLLGLDVHTICRPSGDASAPRSVQGCIVPSSGCTWRSPGVVPHSAGHNHMSLYSPAAGFYIPGKQWLC
jgi:hypothetical protein